MLWHGIKMWHPSKKIVEEVVQSVTEEVVQSVKEDNVIKMDIDGPTAYDIEIATLIYEMNRVGIRTGCSCQGHNGKDAYISIILEKDTTYEYRKDGFCPGRDELILRWRRK